MSDQFDKNSEPEQPELEEELGAYLLGALSPQETQRVEHLLETSESARERLRWMEPAVDVLAAGVERRDPPPGLRSRILDEVETDLELAGIPSRARRNESRGLRFGGFTLRPAIAALGVLFVVAVIGFAGYEVGTGGDEPASKTYASGNAELRVDGDHGNLTLTNVASVAPNRNYQAWVQRDGKMIPSSLFGPFRNGTATAAIPDDLDGAQAVLVTVEPREGSKAPTSPPVATIDLPS